MNDLFIDQIGGIKAIVAVPLLYFAFKRLLRHSLVSLESLISLNFALTLWACFELNLSGVWAVVAYTFPPLFVIGVWAANSFGSSRTLRPVDKHLDQAYKNRGLGFGVAIVCVAVAQSGLLHLGGLDTKAIEVENRLNAGWIVYFSFLGPVFLLIAGLRLAEDGRPKTSVLICCVAILATMIFSTSKASFIPGLYAILCGVYYRKSAGLWPIVLVILIVLTLPLLLIRILPDLPLSHIATIVVDRIFASADQVLYLVETQVSWREYPYSGPLYLVGPMQSLFVTDFITPGVWLQDERFDDRSGFGPNPSYVVDYAVALGPFGGALGLFLGYLTALLRKAGPYAGSVGAYIAYSLMRDFLYSFVLLLALTIVTCTLLTLRFYLRRRPVRRSISVDEAIF